MNKLKNTNKVLHIFVLATFIFSVSSFGRFVFPNEANAADLVVSGYKFHDLNMDGIWDKNNEPALNDWKICATASTSGGSFISKTCELTGDSSKGWADGYYFCLFQWPF